MSRINGDRSRFDRLRKLKMHDRTRIRKLRKAMTVAETAPKPAPAAQA